MSSSAQAAASARLVVRTALECSPQPIVLVDGPSGAGKSTFADLVVAAWPQRPARLVRMDDIYPGWQGLRPASLQVQSGLLAPLHAGRDGGWRRWDWTASEAAEWHAVVPGHPLVVEGCGCLTRSTAPLATLRVWLTADDDVRKRRALARDAGAYDAHWDEWQTQWDRFVREEHPRALADIVLDTTELLRSD